MKINASLKSIKLHGDGDCVLTLEIPASDAPELVKEAIGWTGELLSVEVSKF